MTTARTDYATTVCALTETYLERVTDTTSALADAVTAYETDAEAFEAAVERVATRESACDDALRELRTVVRDAMPPNYTEMYLRIDDVARLYAAIDAVPNRAERFVRELDAMGPTLADDLGATLREMAVLTVEASAILADVVTAYVESLVAEREAVRATESVEKLAELESQCDELKHDALSMAFDSLPTAEALVVRELVSTLDTAMDAVEDAGDQLLFLSSGSV
ncbi:DUF47 domain-containing protein [Halorussus aquaticus]|uniref:DUF47 domain-containing protein n=1 Tax=Halorussus aquaticus TaxID=2953748 RepID=A0ABD5PXG5_9EURY|nr:DUF47 family protein [Halorussus aquaticus]